MAIAFGILITFLVGLGVGIWLTKSGKITVK